VVGVPAGIEDRTRQPTTRGQAENNRKLKHALQVDLSFSATNSTFFNI